MSAEDRSPDTGESLTTPEDLRPEYWAFISYRHLDNQQLGRQWATWLHQQLESYEIPEDLVDTANERGDTIPERLFPIFRDEEELPADADLSTAIRAAVERSKYMIVLCSPRAAESTYVAEEIRYFKELGRADRILAVLIEGEPNASWDEGKQRAGFSPYQECFPTPLMHPVAQDGALDETQRAEPIAADLRIQPGGQQGWTNPAAYREALLVQGTHKTKAVRELVDGYDDRLTLGLNKVIAGALGLPLNTVTERGKAWELEKARRRARRLALWLSLTGVLAFLAILAGGFGLTQMGIAQIRATEALQAKERADNARIRAETGEAEAKKQQQLAEAAQQRAEAGEKAAAEQKERAETERAQAEEILEFMTFEVRDKLEPYVPVAIRREILQTVENYYEKTGRDRGGAAKNRMLSHFGSLGDQALAVGDTETALENYQKVHELARELVAEEPDEPTWKRNLNSSYERLGDVKLKLGQTEAALGHYEAALKVAEELVQLDPENAEYCRDLSVSYKKLGDVKLKLGQTEAALDHYEADLKIMEELVRLDPENAGYRRDLSVSYNRLGDVKLQLGQTEAALDHYEADLKVAEELVRLDPENAEYRRDLSVSYDRLGNVKLQLGQTEAALGHYEALLKNAEELVRLDPENAGYRRDLFISNAKLGLFAEQQGDLDKAITLFAKMVVMMEELVAMDPGNAQWKTDFGNANQVLERLKQKRGGE
tara:strand:- start:557 stop:2707 length:2151 start_codon:yes stop_codon:yes gene_type:complete